jgi:heptosyltransferase-2
LKQTYKNILVFQTAFLGDAFLCIPLMKALRHLYPQAKVTLLCRQGVGDFFVKTKIVHACIEVNKGRNMSLHRAYLKTKRLKPDLVISPHRSFRTAQWVWRLGAPMSIGFLDIWSFFAFKKHVKRPDEKHDVLRQLSLLKGLGARPDKLPPHVMSLSVDVPDNPKFSRFKEFVALSPGSQWETKRWTKEGFIEVARQMINLGHKVVLVGAPNEKPLCAEIAKQLPDCVDLCGQTTVYELAQLLKAVNLLVCNDSGAMHVATAVGTPVVGVFGPTVPSQGYSPWSKQAKVVEAKIGCRPCGAHGHNQCPIGTHDCMKKVRAERVMMVAQELIHEGSI